MAPEARVHHYAYYNIVDLIPPKLQVLISGDIGIHAILLDFFFFFARLQLDGRESGWRAANAFTRHVRPKPHTPHRRNRSNLHHSDSPSG